MESVMDSQEWLRATLSSIGDAVIATDSHGQVVFLNPVAQALTGWTQEQAVTVSLEKVIQILNEETRATVPNPALRALKEGLIVSLANHTRLIARDGTEHPIDGSAAPIRNEKGQTAGAVLVFRDITERKKAERLIRESELRKTALIRGSLDCIIEMDHEERIVEFNHAAERTFGYQRDEVVGEQMAALIVPPSLRARHHEAFARYLATGKRRILDKRIEIIGMRADGTEFPLELTVTRIPVGGPPIFAAFLRDITERKRSEAAMARLTAIVESSDDAIVSKDLTGIITSWNRGAERIFGYTAEEAIGKSVKMLIPPNGIAEESEILDRLACGESIDHYEAVRRRKDGSLLDVSLTISPLKDSSGHIIGASKIARDVTESKRLEQSMRESEFRYRRLFEAAQDGILILDAKTRRIVDANAFITGLTGREHSELVGKELHEIGFLCDVEENKRIFKELQRSGYIRREHLSIKNQRGGMVDLEFIANTYPEDHKMMAQCNIRDISDRIRMQSAIRERMKELSCLYAVSQIIVEAELTRNERLRRIVVELPRAFRYPDRAVARITLDDETFEGPGYECVHSAQQADLVVEDVKRGVVEVGYTSTLRTDAENLFLFEERSLLDNVARQLSLFITRQEGAARRAVLEDQLRHADRLATIGQLAAGVAHEMNEPLSSVLGIAQLALKGPNVPQQVADDLRKIVASSLRAREIVKKLLLFSRQTPPEKTSVNLNEIIEDALFLLEAGSEKQGIRVVRRLAADLPFVQADPIQFRQVVVNLTVNAMQAIAAEGTVTVETRAEGPNVVLAVSDTGHGMSPETLSKIFSPFFTTKDVGEGTGLGLSVVHGIVTSHGGKIETESREGKGTRFIVRLPAARNAEC